MDSILDEEGFQTKIEERANSLFESKDGKPELEVHRAFHTGSGIGVEKNQDVRSVSDLSRLEKVRKLTHTGSKILDMAKAINR
jgi:hypothetical protein